MDFAADSSAFIDALSNATVTAGVGTFRAIYDAPGKQGAIFGEGMVNTDSQVTALQSELAALGVRNGTPVIITQDVAPSESAECLIKQVLPDGMGLSVCTLKKG